tara:strand:+ start:2428 stop:3102 length:675 start_codon:yes stop_codon:yes gene_type:complete
MIKQLSQNLTISDSKRAFNKAFPYVIPAVYRRISDELLVELHLLSHQKTFRIDSLFSLGLKALFDSFTEGYQPAHHGQMLFEAICSSNGYDPIKISEQAENLKEAMSNITFDELQEYLTTKKDSAPNFIKTCLSEIQNKNIHYSRIHAVGIITILRYIKGLDENISDDLCSKCLDISEKIGLRKDRVEKDITLYKSTLEKLSQALDLIKESIQRERKKRDESNK